MNELTSHLRSALTLIDAQVERIGKDLDLESQNLQKLVENRDAETQEQITLLSRSIAELHGNLSKIRRHLVDSYSAAKKLDLSSSEEAGDGSEDPDEPLGANEAAEIRHDEPTTISGVLRSLLMANEPAQRKRSGQLD